MISAFAVKSYFNEDVSPYQAYLASKYPEFSENYALWYEKHKNQLGVSPIELNEKFKDLNKLTSIQGQPKVVDYNYYVDEILQNSASYSVKSKDFFKKLTSDPEIMNIYSAYKNREPIMINEHNIDADIQAPTLAKLDSVMSQIENQGLVSSLETKKPVYPIITNSMLLQRIDSICTEFLENQDHK